MTSTVSATPPEPGAEGDQSASIGSVTPLASARRKRATTRRAAAYQVDGALALKSRETGVDPPVDPASPSAQNVARSAVIVARALLEVLSGRRPASQLTRWTSVALQEDLVRRAPRRPRSYPLQLLRVRVSEQAPGIAEVCAIAEDTARKRVRVIAMRMEHREGEWVVTRLQAG